MILVGYHATRAYTLDNPPKTERILFSRDIFIIEFESWD